MSEPAVAVRIDEHLVATIEIRRPPNNFFSMEVLGGLADALEGMDDAAEARAVVLCAAGKHFCAGADFSSDTGYTTEELYAAAVRIFRSGTPIVAAVQGAAIGGGLGLALAADFPRRCPRSALQRQLRPTRLPSRVRVERHPPPSGRAAGGRRPVVHRSAGEGRRGAQLGLVDRLVPLDELRATAHEVALEIATSAPLAVAVDPGDAAG